MYRAEIHSEDEYVDYLGRHPDHNLLMTNNGVVQVSVTEAERHLAFIKNENRASYRQNPKKSASSLSEPKLGTKQSGRRNRPLPTGKPVARTSESATTTSGASSSSRPPEPAHRAREETGELQKWYGKWYQKVIRHGRVKWEEG